MQVSPRFRQSFFQFILITLLLLINTGCTQTLKSLTGQSKTNNDIPKQHDQSSINQLAKTEFNRLTDMEIRQNIASLRTIMLKLYKRNPIQLKKTRFETAEAMTSFVFDQAQHHGFSFKSLNQLQHQHAITLAFEPHYEGDRVLALIVGLQTMLLKAHGGSTDFYFTNELDPQAIYNYARNIEITIWKLSNAKQKNGQLYLVSNSIDENNNNLSIEREFGKMIGRTDILAISLAEESQRTITRVIQNIASAVFLPI